MSDDISLALSIIALLVSIASVVIVYQQTHILQKTNMLPLLVDLFAELRSPEFKAHQTYVYNTLIKECDPNKTGFMELPPAAALHVLPVSHFFDSLGILVARRIVPEDIVLAFAGGPIEKTWYILEPYIRRERESRNGPYQDFFEHLAARAKANPQTRILRKWRLQRVPTGHTGSTQGAA